MLRARYYPDGDVLAAKPQGGISYVWRSISQGVEVVQAGMIWRIGSGTNVNIWADPWIPSNDTRRPKTLRGNSLLTKVEELIDPTSNKWDPQLVNQTFTAEDAATILSIPICDQYDDFVAWHFDSKGLFSVRSAYRVYTGLLANKRTRQRGESTTGDPDMSMWRQIWKLECPGKVQHFMWRFAHDSHPLLRNVEN